MARRPHRPAPDGTITEHTSGVAHVAELIRHTLPPMHPAGIPLVAAPAAVALLGRRHTWIRTPAAAAALATAAFFRHPERVTPTVPGAVVAPADGEITLIDHEEPPHELGLPHEPLPRISTFLSIFDVHVQRTPIAGTVDKIHYKKGEFLSADLPDASIRNERNSMLIRTPDGQQVVVVQIAGLIARRIVCETTEGAELGLGETYGLIRFGSRVDVYLPHGTDIRVRVGQRAVGAETVFAQLDSPSTNSGRQ